MNNNKKSFIESHNEISKSMSVTAGALSGLIVRFCIAPIDIIKIRLQLFNDPIKYNSITSTIRSIYLNEGINAFWKGNTPAELMYIVYGASQFWAFTTLTNHINLTLNPTLKNLFIGGLSGCFATTVSYPLDLLRTRLASNDKHNFKSLLKECKLIYSNNGIIGFFTGASISMFYVTINTGLSFSSYSFIINNYKLINYSPINELINNIGGITSIAGISAGIISKTLVYPMDLIKRRIQINNTNWLITLQNVIKLNGFKGLYRGLLPALLKSAPATGISLFCYEFFINLFKKYPF